MSTQPGFVAYDDGDIDTNTSANPTLQSLVEQRYSRRSLLRGGMGTAAMFFGGSMLSACGDGDPFVPAIAPSVTGNSVAAASGGKMVALAGVATDTDGTVTATNWAQVSGPTVALMNAATANASFIAPSVAAATPAVFAFTATDSDGLTARVERTLTIEPARLDFVAVPKNLNDIVTVPAGYTASVLYRMGDPLNLATPAYLNNGMDTGFSARAGDHHDGMSYFGLAATGTAPDPTNNTRGLLVMNHENITESYMHPAGPTSSGGVRPTAEVQKEIEAHGVSVVEVTRASTGAWSYVQAGALNRRVTPFTPTAFSGPVRGHPLLVTAFSPTGVAGRGTINNCANGYTVWNTYLTCEENWAGYFRRDAGDNARRTAALGVRSVQAFTRYGLNTGTGDALRQGSYNWASAAAIEPNDTRISKLNASTVATAAADGSADFRNEPNQYGWVVEIDPYDVTSIPRKRTALGRFNHEGAWPSRFVAGVRPAFYMGDDAQGEYCYKFVSTAPWAAADATATNRLAIGDKYLDTGTLYVARFDANGTGAWIPLTFGAVPAVNTLTPPYVFADQADVLTNCRLAGDAVGATRMDRPEWTGVNPRTGEMYLTLTNNSSRTLTTTDAANPRFYNDPRTTGAAQRGNPNGHVIRLRETGDTSEALTFTWDIYVFAAGSDLEAANINLSGLDATNDMSSPDGLWFSRASNPGGGVTPLLWLQTDDGAFTDQTNCMMLVGMPGSVGDGAARTITNTGTDGTTRPQATLVGRAPGTNLRRFLVGPRGCEITGIDSTPDGRTVFVNIQHPGEGGNAAAPTSNWPERQTNATATSRPRSATVVITKDDGGVVGL